MMRTPISGPAKRLTPSATIRRASMSRPESVSSSTASWGLSIASWRISIRFFSPPEKPSFRYRLEKSFGMFVSSIASSVSARKSFSLISASPLSERWALTAIRRYLATVTPGIATGYWNAMKRPIRDRSSGSASVMSSPLKVIVPSVTSRPGCPMIAFARVDLPEPFGPIRAWIDPFSTSRPTPLRISLPSAVTCRLRISSSANSTPVVGLKFLLRGAGRGGPGGGGRVLLRELDQLGERGSRERLRHTALDPRPEKLGRAGLVAVGLVRTGDLALGGRVEALHRGNRALQRLHHLEHLDLVGGAAQAIAAVGSALALHQAGLPQLRHQVLEIGERQALVLGDGAQRDRRAILLTPQLDHQANPVLGSGGKQHRQEILAEWSVMPRRARRPGGATLGGWNR